MSANVPETQAHRGEPSAAVPLVTVMIVCYRHERYVAQALHSAFTQSYRNIELIVTDDASPDGSVGAIREALEDCPFPARFIENSENRGLCATLNQGLASASGSYVALMSADDWMEPHRIERLVELFEALPDDFCLVHSDMFLVDEEGTGSQRWSGSSGQHVDEQAFFDLVRGVNFATPSAMYRRAALDAAGPYDEELPAEDFDMLLRLAQRGRFRYVDEPLVSWRHVPSSVSREAGRLGRFEYYLPSLAKHFGSSPEIDRVISLRISTLAVELYKGGRSRPLAARYLRLAARQHPHKRAVVFAALATARVSAERALSAGWSALSVKRVTRSGT